MASPGNQHYADCIGTLSFPIGLDTGGQMSYIVIACGTDS